MKKNTALLNMLLWVVAPAFCALLLAGCSDGSGTHTGSFVDSPVEGLTFETDSLSGVTDSRGRFSFEPGETVTFSIGGIILGQARTRSIITPLDLVSGASDEKNPTVTNITRLLMSLDTDGDPENGISLSPELAGALSGITINFNQEPGAFSLDPAVLQALEIADTELCTIEDAQEHLGSSLADLKAKSGYVHDGNSGGGEGGGGGG